jgi:hypothetical protein
MKEYIPEEQVGDTLSEILKAWGAVVLNSEKRANNNKIKLFSNVITPPMVQTLAIGAGIILLSSIHYWFDGRGSGKT